MLFSLVFGSITVDTTVIINSTIGNDAASDQTITNEKIYVEDPKISAKFQTGNSRSTCINYAFAAGNCGNQAFSEMEIPNIIWLVFANFCNC